MKRLLSSTALSLSILAITSAFAADGYVTGDVNLRAGPDTSYPRVSMLAAGTPVAIEGCVNGWSWCDVATGDNRGWIAGNFLQEEYQGQRVFVPEYGVQIGIPIVAFAFGAYWGEHYRNRSWYGERNHWSHIRPQYRSVMMHGDQGGQEHGNYYGNSRGANANDARAVSAYGNR
ncbi:MAG: SH3 domain-containing protein, partial [Rudaea sp.]